MCVSLWVSHIFVTHLHWWPSKSLLSFWAALYFLPLQSCHTRVVFFRMPHDSLMARLQIRKRFLPRGLSWLKSSKFASSSLQHLTDPGWLGGVADFDNTFNYQMGRAKGFWSEMSPKGRLDWLYSPSCGLCKPAPGYWNKWSKGTYMENCIFSRIK